MTDLQDGLSYGGWSAGSTLPGAATPSYPITPGLAAFTGNTISDIAAFDTFNGVPMAYHLAQFNQIGWANFGGSISYIINLFKNYRCIWGVPIPATGYLDQIAANAVDPVNSARNLDYYWQTIRDGLLANAQPGAIIIRLAWEWNLAYQPMRAMDGAGNITPASYVAAFRHIVSVFRAVPGGSRFKFDWCLNHGVQDLHTQANIEACYPGDDVVDVIGMDAYYVSQYDSNGGAGTVPADNGYSIWGSKKNEICGFQWHWDFAAAHGKPISYPEWGVDVDADSYFYHFATEAIQTHGAIYHGYFEGGPAGGFQSWALSDGSKPKCAGNYKNLFGTPYQTYPAVTVDTSIITVGSRDNDAVGQVSALQAGAARKVLSGGSRLYLDGSTIRIQPGATFTDGETVAFSYNEFGTGYQATRSLSWTAKKPSTSTTMLNRALLAATPGFAEEFTSAWSIRNASQNPSGRWTPYYNSGTRHFGAEVEYNCDPYSDAYNAFSVVDGIGIITAVPTPAGMSGVTSQPWVSGYVQADKTYTQAHGLIEFRFHMPCMALDGAWPAGWMLAETTFGTLDGGSNQSEMDVMEAYGGGGTNQDKTHFTVSIHPLSGEGASVTTFVAVPDESACYMTFQLYWDATTVKAYVNDFLVATHTHYPSFDRPFTPIINLALGGVAATPTGTAPRVLKTDFCRMTPLAS